MGLGEWFRDFCEELQIRDTTVDSISRRYRAITRRLNTDFWDTTSDTAHSLYVGSYGRNTAVRGFSDLDIIFELPSDVYYQYDGYLSNGQSALLQAVRNSIKQTYSVTNIGADGQVVVIPFDDGMNFEIVPVFKNKAGSYTYPDSNEGGSWRTTNPRAEIQAIRDRNAECNGNLVRLCRMARAWQSTWNLAMGGLLVDTLAYQFIGSWQYRDKSFLYYDLLARDFFKYLSDVSDSQTYWRAPGSDSYVYLREVFRHKAKQCYNLALDAIDYETASPKKEWSAKKTWRDIFGSRFPE